MVGEDRGEPGLVFGLDQALDRAGRELGEGVVGRSKCGKGPGALERFTEIGSGDSSHECIEAAGSHSGVDDVRFSSGESVSY
jgi:hypothetical protein